MKIFAFVAGFGLVMGISPVHAQSAAPASREHAATQAQTAYVPGLGEVMTLQQMRHAKLWLAGQQRNWPLADYELDELREGFEDAAKLHPTHDGIPVAELIAKLTPAPLEALGKAIEAKSATNFSKSFDRLTATCNACHTAAQHGFIRIIRPSGSTFNNQAFTTRKN